VSDLMASKDRIVAIITSETKVCKSIDIRFVSIALYDRCVMIGNIVKIVFETSERGRQWKERDHTNYEKHANVDPNHNGAKWLNG